MSKPGRGKTTEASNRTSFKANVRPPGAQIVLTQEDQFGLADSDLAHWQKHFGVDAAAIRHDYAVSRVIEALAPYSDLFCFYGGTALSRTLLQGLRLSEDIDLLSSVPRRESAPILDRALRVGLADRFGPVTASLALQDAPHDVTPCVYQVGDANIQIQLISPDHFPPWPHQRTVVSQRYLGVPDVELETYSAQAFPCAKTSALFDRGLPRDLYDVWALAEAGWITPEAALMFKRFGLTRCFPRRFMFPHRVPTESQWEDALGGLCVLRVGPKEAYDSAVDAWERAVAAAEASSGEGSNV